MYCDYVSYANGILLITWASIERHILVFSSQFFRLGPTILWSLYSYSRLFDLSVDFLSLHHIFYPCEQVFDYQQVLCSSPCFKRTTFLLNAYDDCIPHRRK
ncbi:unnamed protein product [Rotaria magnacalcarata]|nr:unnamed protein product [Rotaria magnacalcarata]CAF1490780.1 unnamed protein product [Rotaria magnacalcarata]CAF1961941.1 unnamed protein product [Rotaria magnacalcarata]CAF3966554.1 unnamed protein product [Rotaria magnacalcarata]CAF4326808.1 unnamed protein product [Rotaria magnacalcarata]